MVKREEEGKRISIPAAFLHYFLILGLIRSGSRIHLPMTSHHL
jgi:hypothetical protein